MKKPSAFRRMPMAYLPTPLEKLERLGSIPGWPQIWIKRDDRTGLAGGGNKARKLEYLVADALRKNCDLLITAGGAQSNHCRQTAAAAVLAGLDCELVLGGMPPKVANGNLLLDDLLDAQVHWTTPENRNRVMQELAERRRRQGRKPCVIPIGGSNALGALAYFTAMEELMVQLDGADIQPDAVVFATSSGGTQAGLAVGARLGGFSGRLLGISIDRVDNGEHPFRPELAALANELSQMLESPERFVPEDFEVNMDYLGAGYGRMGEVERRAIRLVARSEGILLDPVYTGRAMAGLIDLIEKGEFDSSHTVVFWHTGGEPALYAYAQEL